MHPTRPARRLRPCWTLALVAGLAGAAAAQPPAPAAPQPSKDPLKDVIGEAKVDPKTGTVVVPAGGRVRYDPKVGAPITDLTNSREDVLSVLTDPADPTKLSLVGRIPGLAQVTLRAANRPPVRFEVLVQTDFELLRSLIRRTVPTANVDVTPGIGNSVILGGYATSPQDVNVIERLANSQLGGSANSVINAIQVGGVQQVQIDVVIASVDRNEIRSRGFDFAVSGRSVVFSSIISGLLSPPTGFGAGTVTFSPEANLQLGVAPAGFFSALRALRTEGLAKFLAEPRIVTQTGRPAFFLAGGRQAVLSPSSGITGPGVQFEQVGTSLEVLPVVYGNNQIWLEINPSVRQVNQGLGISTTFGATPGFTEQQARCAVMLESGQTFAIGGLIQSSVQASATRVPVLGDLPFVGTVFSRVNYEERESELVILVTPRLVAPLDCGQVPKRLPGRETRTPDDYELFLEGVLEAPRGPRRVWHGKHYNAPYKSDPSAGPGPLLLTPPAALPASPAPVTPPADAGGR